MGEGIRRRSVNAVVIILWLFLVQLEVSYAAEIHSVGDDLGWTFNVTSWPIGKIFHAGDILAFKYSPSAHNVVVVDKVGYNWCMVNPREATVHHSGNDQIKLNQGINYLICSLPGHCQMGMKLSITTTD